MQDEIAELSPCGIGKRPQLRVIKPTVLTTVGRRGVGGAPRKD
jgi:hypothetical protein